MMQHFLAFRDSRIIPLRLSPSVAPLLDPLPCGLRTRNEESGDGRRYVAVIGQFNGYADIMKKWSGMQRAEIDDAVLSPPASTSNSRLD